MNARINVISLTIEYPIDLNLGKGLFVRARLQAMAKVMNLQVFSPIALLDYANPNRRLRGSRGIPSRLADGATEVFYPRWLYPPFGGFVNPFCLFFGILWPLSRLSRHSRLDVLDAHFVHPDGIAAGLAAWILRKPFIVTVRGSELLNQKFRMRKFWMGWAIRRAARVITVSDNLREFALQMGADPSRVKVIPNGIDTDIFFPRDRSMCRAKHGISPQALVVLSAGNLAEIKGHHRVIQALEALRSKGMQPELLIAGGVGRSGRYAEVLHNEVASRGLEGQVRFLGEVGQAQLAELMSAADIFCLASSREGCPNVVIESLACGTPVIGTDVGAVRRLVPTEQYGYVVAVHEPEGLQEALRDGFCRKWDHVSIAKWGGSRTWGKVAYEVATELRHVAAEASGASIRRRSSSMPTTSGGAERSTMRSSN